MNKDIAIIGISGRFPKADNLDELFDNLKAGVDCIGALSKERIEQTTLPENQQYRNCGYLEDIDKFDYKFFGISLAEAKTMSPEQRILLEVTHAAIENSGYCPAFFNGSNTAIYVSIANSEYYKHASEFVPTLVTGNSPEFLVAKIARQFNLKANASSIESSCSSSLVALHTACNEILVGDADMAIVAGVNLVLFPLLQKEFGLDLDAPDGKSKAFSEHANGMSYGEIAAAVVLKPLEKALADKDIVHAVIKSTAVNNNGVQSSSITAPDSKSQAAVLKKAWIKAGIDPRELSYIEAHGSGTKLGDSLEIEALNLAFGEYTKESQICPISTIKSNTGHARSVAGLAGLFRTVLSLKHKVLFPTLHVEEPSTLIDFKNSAVYINTEFRNWELTTHAKRLAGITSIGVSGTNCHAVLEEAPTYPPEQKNKIQTQTYFHIPLSGKSAAALLQNTKALLKYISKNQQLPIEDISYTLSTGRDPYEYRRSYLVTNIQELTALLHEDVKANNTPANYIGNGKLVFIFSDSTSLTDAVIQDFRKYEAFDKSWISCENIMPLNTAPLKDFAFQYSFYQLLSVMNVTTDHVLPLGIGTIVQQVIDKEVTVEAGLNLAKAYTPVEIQNKQERVKRLVDRFSAEGHVTFLDMAVAGALSDILRRYDKWDDLVYFSAIDPETKKDDFLVHMVHELYKRKIDAHVSFAWIYNSTGRKIELPSYQFEKKRCWLRDQPKAVESAEITGHQTHVLKELTAGNTERAIAEMIAEVLGIKALSIHDNFFELGGDSLKATKVIMKLKEYFHVALDFEDMFDFPQIVSLAAFINKQINTEKKVTIIWETILQTKELQPSDNFFELGGHSLMATTMLVALNKECKVQLNFEDIFQHPTIGQLSACIDEKLRIGAIAAKEEISLAPVQAHYELTYSQKRMWFLNHFEGGNSAYNNVIGVYLDGELDKEMFNRAVFSIIEQHESLRTIFKTVGEEPKQFILDANDIVFQTDIIDVKEAENVEATIDAAFKEEYNYAFDLSVFPLFRTRLIKTGNNKHVCILNQHHIISDGWSLSVFIENFHLFYDHLLKGKQAEIKPLKFQIKDYAEWQYKPYFQSILKKQESYWLDLFSEPVPTLHLPLDHPRPAVQSFEGDHVYFNIHTQESQALKKIAKDSGATLFMVLLSVYNILLSKLGNSEDIAVGTPVAGRRFEGLQPLIGLFVNTIVLRNHPLSELDYTTFLREVKKTMLQALNNQDYPYEELVKKVLKDRDTSRNPIFDTLFLLQNNRSLNADFNNIKTTRYQSKSTTTQFDLLLEAAETTEGIAFDFSYSTVLFRKETILNFIAYFKNCISTIVANPQIKISDIELLPASERKKIIVDWNNTAAEYPKTETVVSLFEKQAIMTPEQVAIVSKNKTISYKQLDELSGKIAAYLEQTLKVKEGDLIGILLEREEQLIPCILGILKTGAAYIPIDPNYPPERIRVIMEDARIKTLISRERFINNASGEITVLNLDIALNAIEAQQVIKLKQEKRPEALAYVIYTSGSTGSPKGVMITHRSLINYISWAAGYYIGKTVSTFPLFTSISFDLTVTSIFTPLVTGNKIILYEEEEDKSLLIEKVCVNSEIDIIKLTPSHLKIIRNAEFKINPEQPIKRFIVGGEELEIKLAEDIYHKFNGRVELYNEYGPTEATVGCMIYRFNPEETHSTVPIGRPIHNMQIYVLDKNLNPVPSGVEGELYISGEGLSKGYLFKEELTNQKFMDHPFLKNERMYRTGDLAVRLMDGNIIFRGRMDGQAKINGFRVETGDIESKLQAHPKIRETVVIVKEKEDEKFLVAYYVAAQAITANELQTYLQAQLPDYMIPARYVKLNSIPLTTNGKINRSALPDPDAQPVNEYVAPVGELEELLVEMWADILKLNKKQISVTRGFFELGGNSIRVIHLINVIRKRKAVKITLREMFENATVQKLAKLITQLDNIKTISIQRVEKREHYVTSPAQQRIFYQQMLDKDSMVFNITAALQVYGDQSLDKLTAAFQQLINRHESLRTSFILTDDGVQQKINEEVTFELIKIDVTQNNELETILNDFVKPYTLAEKSLLRVALVNNNHHGNIVLIDIHHIICDGLSMNILINDFKEIYLGHALPPLALRYIDYAQWQAQSIEKSGKQKAYWSDKLSGTLPRLDLPVMQDRKMKDAYIASSKTLEVKGDMYHAAKRFIAAANVSDFMFLLSINYLLLHKMSGKQDLIIGTDVVGRTQPEFKDIVGTFVNILPLRIEVNASNSYDSFLKNVKELVLEAFDHQDFQFDQMVELLDQKDRMIRNPIVDIHFSVHNAVEGNRELTALAFAPIALTKKEVISQYELKIEVFEDKDKMDILFTYSNALYSDDMMEVFKNYYYNILAAVIKDCTLEIEHIELESLSEAEI